MAFENLNKCIFEISKATLEYLKDTGVKEIDPMTQQTYLYYKERI